MFKLSILSLASLLSLSAFAAEGGGGGFVMQASAGEGGGGGYVTLAGEGGGGGFVMQASAGEGGGGGYVMQASAQLYPVSAIRQHGSLWLVQVFDGSKIIEAVVAANQLFLGPQGALYAQVVSATN